MKEILEVPVISINPEVTKSLFHEIDWMELEEWPGWKYAFFDLTADKQVIFYLIEHFESDDGFVFADQLIPRIPFTWLLISEGGELFTGLLSQYQSRYSTPLFLLANEENKSGEERELSTQENMLWFNSEKGAIRDLLLKALKLAMIENQERDFA